MADVGKSSERLHLPRIAHRVSRFDGRRGDDISINTPRTMSRTSSVGDSSVKHQHVALDSKEFLNKPSRKPTELEESAFQRAKRLADFSSASEMKIPDNVRTVYSTDSNKVSMPVFGISRPGTSSSSFDLSSSVQINQLQIDVDEYLSILRDKAKSNAHEIRTKFRNAEPDGAKGVSREAFAHILASLLGPSKPLSHQNFNRLTDRLGLKEQTLIRYEEFVSCLQEKNYQNVKKSTDWIDPVRTGNSFQTPVTRKATQVFVILKEKAKLRTNDMIRLIPLLNGGNVGKIFRPELMNTINSMGIKMEEDEMTKLWKKFDPENNGFINSDAMLQKFGINPLALSQTLPNPNDYFNSESFSVPLPNIPDNKATNNYTGIKKRSSKSTKKNPIDSWLKKRFRDGFLKMKASFEELDLQNTGQVRRDQFLKVLRQHNLSLEDTLLDAFLERCGLKVPIHSNLISYKDFLERFQNRSDNGIAYRFIINGEMQENRAASAIGLLEKKLVRAFQNDFLGLLQTFRKLDRNKTNTISKQEFRAALESHFEIELSEEEYEEFMRDVPCEFNKVQYLEFMTRFDSDSSSTLFDSQSVRDEDFESRVSKRREHDTIAEENDFSESSPVKGIYNGRSLNELRKIIKEKVRNDYKKIETAWNEVDNSNSNEMSKDMMYELFKRLKCVPIINREEIDLLWNEFILKDNKKLEYWQFVRHFGYSKNSACFQNAKVSPPKRGDNDMMLTSNKLGRDSILIRGSVQSKLIMQFDNLRRSFEEIDPYKTDLLLRDEFEEILRELCPELNKQEMDYICSKYDTNSDGRINYTEFLAPYAPKKNLNVPTTDKINQGEISPSSRLDTNDSLTLKLRLKFSEHYKELRRIFKQHDFKQTGYVPISSFKEVLNSKIKLGDDDMYNLLRRLDKEVTGMINYNKFINEIIKP